MAGRFSIGGALGGWMRLMQIALGVVAGVDVVDGHWLDSGCCNALTQTRAPDYTARPLPRPRPGPARCAGTHGPAQPARDAEMQRV